MVLVRYIISGGVSYLFEVALLHTLLSMNVYPTLAVGMAFWVGFFMAFFIQKMFAFKSRSIGHKKTVVQLATYSVLVGFNYIFTISVVGLLHEYDTILVRTGALAVTTIWNFLIYKYVIFRTKEEETE